MVTIFDALSFHTLRLDYCSCLQNCKCHCVAVFGIIGWGGVDGSANANKASGCLQESSQLL